MTRGAVGGPLAVFGMDRLLRVGCWCKCVGELLAHVAAMALLAQGSSEGVIALAFLMVFSMAAIALEVGVRPVLGEAGRRRRSFAGGEVASLTRVVGVVVDPPGDQPDDGAGENGHEVR